MSSIPDAKVGTIKPPKYSGSLQDALTRWDLIHTAGEAGPLDAKTARLVKLAVAIGAMREGAVHSGVRKALAEGIDRAEIEQVVGLSAGTLGLPATVAVFSWIQDQFAESQTRR